MSRDTFAVWLRNLPADEISFRVLDDGRYVLSITTAVGLYVRSDDDDTTAVVEGLRKLAATADEMAGALSRHGGAA